MTSLETRTAPKHQFVKISRRELEILEDAYDELICIRAYDEAKQNPGRVYPDEIIHPIIFDGANPLKIIREWRRISQKSLAAKADVTPMYISHIETGMRQPSVRLAKKLAKILDVDWDMLVGDD